MLVFLFFIFASVAVLSAGLMLWSDNAVHSALFLILNFACIAFFFLMLDAPFLAMVQIAVYAGAIMVLFLFVIMLLGAEQPEPTTRHSESQPGSRSYVLVAGALAGTLLLVVGVLLLGNTIDVVGAEPTPNLRFIHASPGATAVNVEVGGDIVGEDIAYGGSTGMFELTPGTYPVTVTDFGTGDLLLNSEIDVIAPPGPNFVTTVAIYDTYAEFGNTGEVTRQLTTFRENLNPGTADETKLTVFNGSNEAVSLVDTGIFNRDGDTTIIRSSIPPGEASTAIEIAEGEYDSLRFVLPTEEELNENEGVPVFTLTTRDFLEETNTLIMLLEIPNAQRPTARFVETDTLPLFGSPQAVGQLLMVNYLLPMQLVALVLLASLVGVILIAQQQVSPESVKQSAARRPVRRRVSRPLTSVIASQVQADTNKDAPRLESGDGTQPAGD